MIAPIWSFQPAVNRAMPGARLPPPRRAAAHSRSYRRSKPCDLVHGFGSLASHWSFAVFAHLFWDDLWGGQVNFYEVPAP